MISVIYKLASKIFFSLKKLIVVQQKNFVTKNSGNFVNILTEKEKTEQNQ